MGVGNAWARTGGPSQVSCNGKQPIPITPLMCLYRTMRRMSEAARLDLARELCESVDAFAGRVGESIERFSAYKNTAEPFCPAHAALELPDAIAGGRSLAAALVGGTHAVAGQSFSVQLIDYEVPPARTTVRAPLMLNRFEDGTHSTTTMKIDLLLRHDDGTPIIGEAKVARKDGYDTDAVLALIQALAGATQFATPSQQRRLAIHYPSAFAPCPHVDVAIVAYQPPVCASSTYQKKLDAAARALANSLVSSERFPIQIRKIHFIRAYGQPSALSLEEP
jgi:hypothetical protein